MAIIGSAKPITITSDNFVYEVRSDLIMGGDGWMSNPTSVTIREHVPDKPVTIQAGFYHAEDGSLVSHNLDLDADAIINPGCNRDHEVSREIESHGFVFDNLTYAYVRES